LRAVVPVVLGITKFEKKQYRKVNLWAAIAWVGLTLDVGYLPGHIPWVQHNLEICILIVIVVTSLPMPVELLREWLTRRCEQRQ
jgi:membrane-associated protein